LSYLRYLCLFAYSGVQLILCCALCFCFSFRLVFLMLPIYSYVFILRNHGSILMTNIAGYINDVKMNNLHENIYKNILVIVI
jgi:hypothetical protein